uniref:Serpin domain-containing protein n=1 Tax=Romanomermis culicivorax TaxID=13658 RepID=A0A915KJH3_ROMCU
MVPRGSSQRSCGCEAKTTRRKMGEPKMQINICRVDIDLGENGGQIVQLINEDVSNKTRGKITDLLPYHLLKSSTPMALVNAVYFKAEWDKGFGPDKHHKTFRTTVYGPIKAVKMMSSTIHVPYFENDEFQIVSLPLYSEGLKFNVYFLLPRIENGTESLVKACAKLGAEGALMSIPTKLPDKFVKVTIPNFHINHNDDLINELQSIGIQDMFEKGSSDFSSLLLNHNSDMYIHKFQHKASIWIEKDFDSEKSGLFCHSTLSMFLTQFIQNIRCVETGVVGQFPRNDFERPGECRDQQLLFTGYTPRNVA